MGAQDTCGGNSTLVTYPAWTFAGKHKGDKDPHGPGTGKYASNGVTWVSPSARFGPPRTSSGPYYTAGNTGGTAHLRPGGLSGERRNPSYSFGARLPGRDICTPGPLDYQATPAWASTAKQSPQPSWGPPPKPRPMSAPRPVRVEHLAAPKARGPTFGLPHQPIKHDPVPGPRGYCDRACSACNRYSGASFGLRPPMMYGQKGGVVGQSPGPQNYHTGCSTLGAATHRCTSSRRGSRSFNPNSFR